MSSGDNLPSQTFSRDSFPLLEGLCHFAYSARCHLDTSLFIPPTQPACVLSKHIYELPEDQGAIQRQNSIWLQICHGWRSKFNELGSQSLTLSRVAPSAVSKGWGGADWAPPWFLRVLGGCGFKFWWQPHILLRLTPDKRIYNFRIPRTTPTHGILVCFLMI